MNRAPGRWVRVSQLFFDALEAALGAADASGGSVDPTLGRVLRLAGYDRGVADAASAQGPARISLARAPGWRQIRMDYVNRAVRVPHGIELDLGATAKALAADRAARDCSQLAGCGVLVNLGGDIAVAGPAPNGGWPIRVTDDQADPHGQTVSIESGGLADVQHRRPALGERRTRAAPHLRSRHRPAREPRLAHGERGRRQLRGGQHRQHGSRRAWDTSARVAHLTRVARAARARVGPGRPHRRLAPGVGAVDP